MRRQYSVSSAPKIRKELTEKLQPKLDAVKAKWKFSESGSAGAKSLIELIKALDNNASATPTTIPAGAVGILVNMAIGSPAICTYRLFNSNEVIAKELAKKVFVS